MVIEWIFFHQTFIQFYKLLHILLSTNKDFKILIVIYAIIMRAEY